MNPFKAIKDSTYKVIRNITRKSWADQLMSAMEYNEQYLGGSSLTLPAQKSFIIWKVLDYIAKHTSSIPLEYYVGDTQVKNTPFSMIFQIPNYYQTTKDLISDTAAFYTLYGNAFWWLYNEGTSGDMIVPDAIFVLDPRGMTPIIEKGTGMLVGWKSQTGEGKVKHLTLDQVIQFKNTNVYNRYFGTSPLDAAKIEINTDYKSSQYNLNFFTNGARFSNVLEVPARMTKPEMKKLLKELDQVHQGSDKAHKTLVIKDNMKITPNSMTQTEMDFINSRKFTRDNILTTFGMSKSVFGYAEDINRATADRYAANYWQNTVIPITIEIMDKVNHRLMIWSIYNKTPKDFRIKFNYSDIEALWFDMEGQAKIAEIFMRLGSTREEVYERFNFGIPVNDELAKNRFMSRIMVPYGTDSDPIPVTDTETPVMNEITDETTVIKQMLTEYRNDKSRDLKIKFDGFFKKQKSKILKKLNKGDLDLDLVFEQEKERIFNYFVPEIKEMWYDLSKLLPYEVEFDTEYVEKVTEQSLRLLDAKSLVIDTFDGEEDKFQYIKDIYGEIDKNNSKVSKDFCNVAMNMLLLKYKDLQKDIEAQYYLEEK